MSVQNEQEPRPSATLSLGLTLGFLSFLAAFPLTRGMDFYRRTLDARFDHPDYRVLSPGGMIGHGYGILGTALILTNLLYLARRRLAWLPIGSLARWLDLHVVTGLSGSILVLFHSAFQLRTPIAMATSASLSIVVLTGVIGRYIYALTPRTGDATIEDRLQELDESIPTFSDAVRKALRECPTTRLPANASPIRVILTIPRWIFEARRRRRAVRRAAKNNARLSSLKKSEPKFVKGIVKEIARLSAGELDRIAGGSLLRLWRSLHRSMAIMMVLSVTLHIGVAWFYGYRWIFSK